MRKIYMEALSYDETQTDAPNSHFLVRFNRPGRIEVTMKDGHLVAHVYEGSETDLSQEPVGVYDSAVDNESWGV